MNKRIKVAVIIPAYNSENTLGWVYRNIPKKGIDGVIIVDDGFKDNTVGLMKSLLIFLAILFSAGYNNF